MKGSMLDMIFIPVVLLVIGIGIFVSAYILSALSATDVFSETPSVAQTMTQATAAVETFNWGFLIIAFGLGFGAVAYGYLYPSHPIFIVFGIIVMVFSMVTTPMISNVFGTFTSDSQMTTVESSFPLITWIMGDPLPIFIAVFGFLIVIVMYSRIRGGTA